MLQVDARQATLASVVIIGVSSGKGGVGKTALAFNLAHLLSDSMRVLAVDADPQASLTWAFGIEPPSLSLADVLSAPNPRRVARDALVEIHTPTLSVLPASIALAGVELSMAGRISRETVLRRALEALSDDYDIALIDSTPSLGLLAINALAASDGVLLPVIADGVSLHAIGAFLDTLDEVRAVNPDGVRLIGVVVTMFNEQLSHHAAGVESIEGAGLAVLVEVGRTVRIAESMAAHVPLREFDKHNERNDELAELAKVVKRWQRQHHKTRR